jgi:hypothetical protein
MVTEEVKPNYEHEDKVEIEGIIETEVETLEEKDNEDNIETQIENEIITEVGVESFEEKDNEVNIEIQIENELITEVGVESFEEKDNEVKIETQIVNEIIKEVKIETDMNTDINSLKAIKHEKIEEYLFDDYEEPEFVAKINKTIETNENSLNFIQEKEINKEIIYQDINSDKKALDYKTQEIQLNIAKDIDTKNDLDIIKKIVEEAQLKVDALKSERNISLNDSIIKGINIGLNDRIGFVKYLFNGSNEDYNRVISQLTTIESFKEAHEFINIHVKPDYNKWIGKEDYEIRFLNLIEKKYL